jgi:hypothetical protein
MLTGCLRSSAADPAVSGPSGRIYTLEVTEEPRPATESTTTAPAAAKTITYTLAASETLALSSYADEKVEVTGRLQPPAASPATKRDAPAAENPAANGAQKGTAGGGHRTFQVAAVKTLGAKCP